MTKKSKTRIDEDGTRWHKLTDCYEKISDARDATDIVGGQLTDIELSYHIDNPTRLEGTLLHFTLPGGGKASILINHDSEELFLNANAYDKDGNRL